MNYLEPDQIWKIFNINSEADFLNKIVLAGKFHPLVPEEIVKDYSIVERLLFYSYFHYPIIDEAFSKSTRIFEAGVTLKLENLGLRKEGFETLHSKLTRLKGSCSNDLFEQWKWAKELRNSFAHKEAGVLFGITLVNAFKHNLNLINSLFLEKETITEKENQLVNLLTQSENFTKGLFILQFGNEKILICGASPYVTGIFKNSGQSLWVFIPISGNQPITELKDYPKSFIIKLENIEINGQGLFATDSQKKEAVSLIPTNEPENIQKMVVHHNKISGLEATSPHISVEYMAMLLQSVNKAVSNFMYEDW